MRKDRRKFTLVAGISAAAIVGGGAWLSRGLTADEVAAPAAAAVAQAAAVAEVRENLAKLPLSFEENRGQTDEAVRFVTRGSGATVWLTDDAAVFGFSADGKSATDVLRMQFVGAGKPAFEGRSEQATKSHYMRGGEEAIRGVSHYGEVVANDLYAGVELRWYGDKTKLEYDLTVAPGVDPSVVRMEMKGADSVRVREDGSLAIRMGEREVVQQAPVAYQMKDGAREIVAAQFDLSGEQIGFRLGSYDASRPLVIDPALTWSTYLGGAGDETGNRVAVSPADGSVVVCGATTSIDLPLGYGHIPNAPKGGTDAYVSKVKADGSFIMFSTYLAGSDYEEAHGVAVDPTFGLPNGDIWVTGQTFSNNFPTYTPNQPLRSGGWDAFLVGLDKNGDVLRYASYFGGSENDYGRGIAVSFGSAVHVTGFTASGSAALTQFPQVAPFQGYGGGAHDAFVATFLPTFPGGTFVKSSFFGGFGDDRAYDIALNPLTGGPHVCGYTTSVNFPHYNVFGVPLNHTVQDTLQGSSDAFVAAFAGAFTFPIWSTYLGGVGDDWANGLAVSPGGDVAVTGKTNSIDFPRVSAHQANRRGPDDAFVAKILANGYQADFSTYLGGHGSDSGNGVAINPVTGDVYVIGTTSSWDFPATNDGLQTGLVGGQNTDAFLARFGTYVNMFAVPQSGILKYASYFGGTDFDYGNGIAYANGINVVAITGTTRSGGAFPLVTPLQSSRKGDSDAFVTRVDLNTANYFPAGEVVAAPRTADSIEISWQKPADGADALEIQRTDSEGAKTTVATVAPTVTEFVDTGLQQDTNYSYTVFALANDGTRVASNLTEAATLPVAPATPTGFSAIAEGAKVTLAWTDVADNESAYVIEMKTSGQFETFAKVKAGATRFETTQVLSAATQSTWRVVAENRGGSSVPSNEVVVTTAPTLQLSALAGNLVDAPKSGADKITVKGRVSGATGFDPNTQAVRIVLGARTKPLELVIPAASRGWKVKGGSYSFDSARGFLGGARFKLDVDAAKGTFSLTASAFDFPAPISSAVVVGLSLGDKAGAADLAWATKGAGKYSIK
jgi:hypothetical protein